MINYSYLKNCQENEQLLKSYFDFTRRVFDFDLVNWRNAGHWKDKYIPHSLVSGNRVIANISASIMQLQINGKDTPSVQLGSVGVLPEYRGKGLSRVLMERVLEEYKDYPLIFLFATDDVSGFYPRFGFRRINESYPFINTAGGSKRSEPVKITLESEPLRRLLGGRLQRSSMIDARENTSIYWYHLMYNFHENIYYIKEKDIAFIADYHDDSVDVYDVLSENKVSFEEIKGYILKDATRHVRFHFTPDWLDISYDVFPRNDYAIYVYGEFLASMDNCKFPETART